MNPDEVINLIIRFILIMFGVKAISRGIKFKRKHSEGNSIFSGFNTFTVLGWLMVASQIYELIRTYL